MNAEHQSLYDRVGGEAGITRLVDMFYDRILVDEALAGFFKKVSIERLKNMQKEFFSVALGGPIDYSGLDLSHAHRGRGINAVHFKAFVEHLFETLREFNLTEDERYQIISQINRYVDDIADDSAAPLT